MNRFDRINFRWIWQTFLNIFWLSWPIVILLDDYIRASTIILSGPFDAKKIIDIQVKFSSPTELISIYRSIEKQSILNWKTRYFRNNSNLSVYIITFI